MIKIIVVRKRTPELISKLIYVWELSVKATHLFLSEIKINEIKKNMPQTLSTIENLVIAISGNGLIIGFMGIENKKLEMIFIIPEKIGQGIGKQLIKYAIQEFFIHEVSVNEQNKNAIGFYKRMGFKIYKRTDYDKQGRAYPLLYMKL